MAVTVSSVARARSAAMPPPPVPGARAALVSRRRTRASPPALTRAGPDRKRIQASRQVSLYATNESF